MFLNNISSGINILISICVCFCCLVCLYYINKSTECVLNPLKCASSSLPKIPAPKVGTMPRKQPCPRGMRDDGTSCWEDWKCSGFPLKCSGCGCIKKTLMQRQACDEGQELRAGLCYKK